MKNLYINDNCVIVLNKFEELVLSIIEIAY